MIRAVLDTSILAAAFLKPGGINHRVLREAGRRYRLYLCRHIIEELERVLRYPRIRKRYRYSDEEIEGFLEALGDAFREDLQEMPSGEGDRG